MPDTYNILNMELYKKLFFSGDCLRLVNGQEITWNNIDEVFTRLCSSSEVGTLYDNLMLLFLVIIIISVDLVTI